MGGRKERETFLFTVSLDDGGAEVLGDVLEEGDEVLHAEADDGVRLGLDGVGLEQVEAPLARLGDALGDEHAEAAHLLVVERDARVVRGRGAGAEARELKLLRHRRALEPLQLAHDAREVQDVRDARRARREQRDLVEQRDRLPVLRRARQRRLRAAPSRSGPRPPASAMATAHSSAPHLHLHLHLRSH